MDPLASTTALDARLGINTEGVDLDRAQAALEDASALIRAEAGMTWEDEEVPAIIVAICLAVAYRAFKNPDAITQSSLGDLSVSYSKQAGGAVFLTADERRLIRGVAGNAGMRSITLVTPYGASPGPLTYVPVVDRFGNYAGDPLPMGEDPLP